jgi:hypothetical protein
MGSLRISVTYLICSFAYRNGAANLSGSTTIYDTVVDNEIANCANSIVQCPLGFIDNL